MMQRIFSALVLLFMALAVAGCEEQILHDLSESEANRVVSRLRSSAVEPRKVVQSDGRWAIAVARQQVGDALAFLDSQRVLSVRSVQPARGAAAGLVPSRQEQWFSYQQAVARSIESTLNSIDGVLEAHVHLHLPERDPLLGRKSDEGGSGSVLLLIGQRCAVSDEQVAALVAGAAGVPAERVKVLRNVAVPEVVSALGEAGERGDAAGAARSGAPSTATALPFDATEPAVLAASAVVLLAVTGFGVRQWRVRRRRRPRFSVPEEDDDEC
jgi:type III secretion protein J